MNIISGPCRMHCASNFTEISSDILSLLDNSVTASLSLFIPMGSGKIGYNNFTQAQYVTLFKRMAGLLQTFIKTYNKELLDSRNYLTIEDPITHKEVSILDITDLQNRIGDILGYEDLFTIIRLLALCNKFAHSFDNDLTRVKTPVRKIYDALSNSNSLKYKTLDDSAWGTLFLNDEADLSAVYNEYDTSVKEKSIYDPTRIDYLFDISQLDIDVLEELCTHLLYECRDNYDYRKRQLALNPERIGYQKDMDKIKKYLLETLLGIDVTYKNTDALFDYVTTNLKEDFYLAYVTRKYRDAMKKLDIQNNMFLMKSNFVSIIAQLLTRTEFSEIDKHLGFAPKDGFDYMLVIDDKSLAYYVEVHLPNYLSDELEANYGYIKESSVPYSNGATAIYERKVDEQQRASRYKSIAPKSQFDVAKKKIEVLSRPFGSATGSIAHTPSTSGPSLGGTSSTPSSSSGSPYFQFVTKEIKDSRSCMANYVIANNIHMDFALDVVALMQNENLPLSEMFNIVNRKSMDLYNTFDENQKIDFIRYTLISLDNSSEFDSFLYNYIVDNYLSKNREEFLKNIDTISKILINSSAINYCDYDENLEVDNSLDNFIKSLNESRKNKNEKSR